MLYYRLINEVLDYYVVLTGVCVYFGARVCANKDSVYLLVIAVADKFFFLGGRGLTGAFFLASL